MILEFICHLKFRVFFKNPSISIDICAYDLRIHIPSKILGFFKNPSISIDICAYDLRIHIPSKISGFF